MKDNKVLFKLKCIDRNGLQHFTDNKIYEMTKKGILNDLEEWSYQGFTADGVITKSFAKWELVKDERKCIDVILSHLELENNEIFEIQCHGYKYRFNDGILQYFCNMNNNWNNTSSDSTLIHIIYGDYKIIKQRRKPAIRETYYYIKGNGKIGITRNDNVYIDKELINKGNCFKSKEEITQKHIDTYLKWVNIEIDIFKEI